jgi:hypothetical protein
MVVDVIAIVAKRLITLGGCLQYQEKRPRREQQVNEPVLTRCTGDHQSRVAQAVISRWQKSEFVSSTSAALTTLETNAKESNDNLHVQEM